MDPPRIRSLCDRAAAFYLVGGKYAIGTSKAKYVTEQSALDEARGRVKALLDRFPVYPELDLYLLTKHFG